jgi:sigma-B regulation protein RsbU (phosphoserine phosphatase)
MSTGANDSRLVRNLDALLAVSKAMASAIDLDSLLAVIQTHATEVMEAERGTIFIHEEETGTLWNRSSGGLASGDLRVPVGAGIAGQVARTREMLNVPDAYADPRFNPDVDRQTHFRTRSILCAPLLGREGTLLGVIQVLNKVEGGAFRAEDEALLAAFASHAAIALDRARLIEAFVEKQRFEEGLRLAHDIQMGMLPRRFPVAREFELAADLRPARSVGGDLYDFLQGDDQVWFMIGDVSGKGVAAALFMAVAKTLFHAGLSRGASPASVFSRMNRELCRDNEGAMFVTAFAGCLDLRTGAVATVNAGHPRPFRLSEGGAVTELAVAPGLPLGVSEDYDYAAGALALAPGDALYLYTDGVTEALDDRGAEFSSGRLESTLRGLAGSSAAGLVTGSLAAVQAFAGATPPSDDIAILSVRFLARADGTG